MAIMIVLVVVSLTLSMVVFIYLLRNTDLNDALSFTVVLIVASIPLAIEIVTTTTLAVGSKELSKYGAIVTRLSAIEDLAGMSILCSDKTGTLTMNKMEIQDDTPTYANGETQSSILRYAAMATKWKEPPKDALDTMVLGAVNFEMLKDVEQVDFLPFDPIVKRTEGTVRESVSTELFKVTKGAPHVLCNLIDDIQVTKSVERDVLSFGERGVRCLAVARTNRTGKWVMLGLLTFLDPPRRDTRDVIF